MADVEPVDGVFENGVLPSDAIVSTVRSDGGSPLTPESVSVVGDLRRSVRSLIVVLGPAVSCAVRVIATGAGTPAAAGAAQSMVQA